MSNEVRVCVIGAGRTGKMHGTNFRWRVPYASLEAIVDADLERAQQLAGELDLGEAAFASLEQALNGAEFDAVFITTPTFSHANLAITAAQAGKHVLCEKPMALTLAECDQMIAAAQQAGVVLQIAFMRRFDAAFVSAKRQIEEGLIGEPLIVRSLSRGPGLPPPWACDISTSNGMLAEVNSHDLDAIRWLAGSNYTSIYAQANALKVPHLREQYPGFYDTAVVILQMESGAFGMLDGICPVDYGYDARAEVVGSKGVIFIGELRDGTALRVTREGKMVEEQFLSWRTRFRQAYIEEATHFVASIRSGESPIVTGLDGRHAVEAALAANKSISTGQPVALPLTV